MNNEKTTFNYSMKMGCCGCNLHVSIKGMECEKEIADKVSGEWFEHRIKQHDCSLVSEQNQFGLRENKTSVAA